MSRVLSGAAASIATLVMLVIGTTGALAYQPGTIGYDISYPQCGTTYPTSPSSIRSSAPPAAATIWRGRSAVPVSAVQPTTTPAPGISPVPPGVSGGLSRGFGIVGVDSGYPFISPTHPGNPCLADEYAHTPNPALYVNTGYDPLYTDANHTLPDCTTKSASIIGDATHKAAWAVGCSEAEKDLAYVASQGIVNAGSWWLDVETANSWCSPPPSNCTDLTLNQYSIQGLIDTLLASGASPVGVYSNKRMWSIIVGANSIHGQTADWYATGTTTAQAAAPYCAGTYSFTGDPVKLAQFVSGVDFDYAC